MKRLLMGFVLMVTVAIATNATAAPYHGQSFAFTQPDGSWVPVYVYGDEYYSRVESADGYTLIRDADTNVICYAELSEDGHAFVATDLVYTGNMVRQQDVNKHNLTRGLRLPYEGRMDIVRKRQAELGVPGDIEAAKYKGRLAGDIIGLTVLVDFSDEPATISRDEVENMLNQVGYTGFGNNGSVHDYYDDMSMGALNYTHYVADYWRAIVDPENETGC